MVSFSIFFRVLLSIEKMIICLLLLLLLFERYALLFGYSWEMMAAESEKRETRRRNIERLIMLHSSGNDWRERRSHSLTTCPADDLWHPTSLGN